MTTPADLRLGPLTTTFTALGACNSITVSTDTAASTAAPYIYPRYFSSIANSCFPSLYPLGSAAIATTFGAYGYHDEHVYFSPGICPSGWNSNIAGSSGSGTTAETTAFCCMPGFGPQTTPAVDGAWGYYSTYCTMMLGAATVTTVPYTGDGAADGGTMTFTFSGNTIPAGAVWIRWRSADFATTTPTSAKATTTSTGPASTTSNILTTVKTETVSLPPASSAPPSTTTTVLVSVSTETVPVTPSGTKSAPSSSSSPTSSRFSSSISDSSSSLKSSTSPSGTPTSSTSTSTSNPPPTSTSSPSSGLSTGGKIGIGVSAGLAVLLALAILIFLFRRRKEKQSYPDMVGGPEVEAMPGLRGGGGGVRGGGAKELPAVTTGMRPMSELPAGEVRSEMLFSRSELAAGHVAGHGGASSEVETGR